MVVWKIKSCPRCHGDVFIDKDIDGWYQQCLQCAHRSDLRHLAEPKQSANKEKVWPMEEVIPLKTGT